MSRWARSSVFVVCTCKGLKNVVRTIPARIAEWSIETDWPRSSYLCSYNGMC
jgi:hypothetical protein